MSSVDFKLYLITDRRQIKNASLPDRLREVVSLGVKAIQLREKDLSPVAFFHLAKEIKEICKKSQTKLLINDRVDIARALDLHGVQLTSQSLPAEAARKCLSSEKLIGVSTHSLAEAYLAENAGCDFILFGPIFQTHSKMKYGPPQGLSVLSEITTNLQAPIFAVGGIDPEKAKWCLEHGAAGVAVISAVMQAENVEKIIADFKKNMGDL
ncbi:MAG: thiamine phosphate synthase [bacterium]